MDRDTFERLVARTRLSGPARRMARRVLVEGAAAAAAARDEGLSRQRAYDAVSRVLREHRRGGGYPSDWQAVTVVVPALTADLIREIERRHRRDAGLQVD